MALLSCIKKDVKWRLSDPISLLMWIGIPLLIGGTMAMVFGGGGISMKVKLLVADQDDNFITQVVTGALDGSGFVQVEQVKEATGRQRISDGEASGFLVIPKGFAEAALDNQPTELELLVNPSQTIGPKIVRSMLELGVEAHHYAHLIGGDTLQDLAKEPPKGQSFFLTFAAKGMQMASHVGKLKKLDRLIDPFVLSVEDELTPKQQRDEEEQAAGTKQSFNFGILLFPGVLFMSLMFIAQGVTYDVWREKDLGTLSRLLCSPTGPATFMMSKMISGSLVIATVAAAGLLLGYLTFDLPLAVLPGALGWIIYAGATLLALFFFVQMLATSSRGANILSSVLVFPLMMLGGSFVPFESMQGLEAIGRYTPNGLAVTQLSNIVKDQVDSATLSIAALQLGIGTLVFFALASRLLRTRLATS